MSNPIALSVKVVLNGDFNFTNQLGMQNEKLRGIYVSKKAFVSLKQVNVG